MAAEASRLPWIDFSGVDPSAPGDGEWSAVRARVVDALATVGCFEAHYPALAPHRRAALFDAAVKPLFALPAGTKLRNSYGPGKPLFGYLGGAPGVTVAHESLAIADRVDHDHVRAFADLMWPDGRGDANAGFCEAVHGAAAVMVGLEEAVRRMVVEGLGVAGYLDAMSESTRHVFRMSAYKAPGGGGASSELFRYKTHQDLNTLTVICQHEVEGLEVRTRDGDGDGDGDGGWIPVKPSPATLVVMAGNALRAWTNDRVHAPVHRVAVGGDATRYSAMLFAVPEFKIQAPEELVDDEHPLRFKPHYMDDFIRFCVSQGAHHQDKLKAYCGV
ncbi:hypothetical protein ACP4OV_008606 [Aristida adscensionis]